MKRLILFIIAGLAAIAVFAATRSGTSRAAAEIMPPGALVYVEIADADAVIDRWRDSKLREKLLTSRFYKDLVNRHLAARLIDRFDEAESALGFSPDLETLKSVTDGPIAAALYDVGRLEFILVAEISGQSLAATAFGESVTSFELIEYRGTRIYRREFSAARGREKMTVLFAAPGGRIIISTSENLLRQTIDNLGGGRPSRGLAATKSFRELAGFANERSLCSLWLDIERLRRDSYFRRYFIGSGSPSAETAIAARSEIVENDDGFSEFRYSAKRKSADLGQRRELERLIPAAAANAPFMSARTISAREASAMITRLTGISDAAREDRTDPERLPFLDWEESRDNEFPSSRFDDVPSPIKLIKPALSEDILQRHFASDSNPAVLVEWPVVTGGLAGFTTRRAVAFRRGSMKTRLVELERDLALILNRELAAGANAFEWRDFSFGDLNVRELRSPVAGSRIYLFADARTQILATDAEMIQEMTPGEKTEPFDFDEFTAINTRSAMSVFLSAFKSPASRGSGALATDLSRDLGALFEVFDDVGRIEIKRRTERGLEISQTRITFAD